MSPHHTSRTWTAHEPMSANRRTLTYDHKPGEPCTPPKKGVKISLQSQTRHTLIFTNSCTIPVNIRCTHIQQPDPSTKKALTRIIGPSMELQGDKNELVKALEEGTLQGALDGSVKNKKGTGAWMVVPKTYQKLSDHSFRGAGPVDGDPDFLHSTRAERSANIAPLYVAWCLAKEYNIMKGKLTMHVDNTASFLDRDPHTKVKELLDT